MRFFNNSSQTGSKAFDFYTRRPSDIVYLRTVLKSKTNVPETLRSGVRYYLPENQIIQDRICMGLIFLPEPNFAIFGAPIVSTGWPYPFNSVTIQGLQRFLTLTLCDENGTILFDKIPVRSLANVNRKFKPYSGKICTYKSYFQFVNFPIAPNQKSIVCNIGFYLK